MDESIKNVHKNANRFKEMNAEKTEINADGWTGRCMDES
jgi:hypothetical protein